MNRLRGDNLDEMSISMCDHAEAEKGGVRSDRGIQWTEETSVDCSSGTGLNGEVWTNTEVSGYERGDREGGHTEWAENHEQTLAQARRDFPLVQPSDLYEFPLCQVHANLLPRLPQSRVQRAFI